MDKNKGFITDKAALEEKLREIAATPYMGELHPAACCYAPVYRGSTEYVCLVCNRVTLLPDDVVQELECIREMVSTIKKAGYDVSLDERGNCAHCSPRNEEVREPCLVFSIRFTPEMDYHSLKMGKLDDYRCLLAFLEGKDYYEGTYGETHPLHENIHVIVKMTGLGADVVKKKTVSRQKRAK